MESNETSDTISIQKSSNVSEVNDKAELNEIPNDSEMTITKKRRRGGTNDLSERRKLKEIKSVEEKLNALKTIKLNVPEKLNELTEGARSFVITQLNPIMSCLENHFLGDESDFVKTWGNFSISLFSKKNCNGKGNCRSK